uniref:Acid phosphatase n=1 Tax=Ganoderma boninense TaxID=34458 RepID=A0A5K1JVJ0_9APHY|nr:Acid phosphatase [Ganoderma boninense]
MSSTTIAEQPAPTVAVNETAHAHDDRWAAQEGTLTLAGGRIVSYSHVGPQDSETVILWFHGLFSVGDASNPPGPIRSRNARFIAPTLPGWGDTSPLAPGTTFPEAVVADTRAILEHLYPDHNPATSRMRIYVAGGSFGTCPAQVIFGAPYDKFPFGKHIVAVMLLAPMSPPLEDPNYNKSLKWQDWLSVGAPSRIVPFNLILRSAKMAIQGKLKDTATAERFLRGLYFDNMDEKEKARFAEWRERRGAPEGDFERRMAQGMVRSVSHGWDGFLGTADALHSDWGFRIGDLDEDHQRKQVVIAVGKGDTSMFNMSRFLVNTYKRTTVVEYEGGHLSAAWSMDEIWEDTLAGSGV